MTFGTATSDGICGVTSGLSTPQIIHLFIRLFHGNKPHPFWEVFPLFLGKHPHNNGDITLFFFQNPQAQTFPSLIGMESCDFSGFSGLPGRGSWTGEFVTSWGALVVGLLGCAGSRK